MKAINFKKIKNVSVGEDVKELETTWIAGRNVKWYSCGRKQYGVKNKIAI
jgi:hypothetical protein